MEKHIEDLDQKINLLIQEEKRQGPSPLLASKIEDAIFAGERQTPILIFHPAFQTILSGMIILLCAYLGFAAVHDTSATNLPVEKSIYFNELKMEPLENRILQ